MLHLHKSVTPINIHHLVLFVSFTPLLHPHKSVTPINIHNVSFTPLLHLHKSVTHINICKLVLESPNQQCNVWTWFWYTYIWRKKRERWSYFNFRIMYIWGPPVMLQNGLKTWTMWEYFHMWPLYACSITTQHKSSSASNWSSSAQGVAMLVCSLRSKKRLAHKVLSSLPFATPIFTGSPVSDKYPCP